MRKTGAVALGLGLLLAAGCAGSDADYDFTGTWRLTLTTTEKSPDMPPGIVVGNTSSSEYGIEQSGTSLSIYLHPGPRIDTKVGTCDPGSGTFEAEQTESGGSMRHWIKGVADGETMSGTWGSHLVSNPASRYGGTFVGQRLSTTPPPAPVRAWQIEDLDAQEGRGARRTVTGTARNITDAARFLRGISCDALLEDNSSSDGYVSVGADIAAGAAVDFSVSLPTRGMYIRTYGCWAVE